MGLLGTRLTFEEVYKRRVSRTEFVRVDHIKVYLDGTPIGTFERDIVNSLRHLLKVGNRWQREWEEVSWIWERLAKETIYLIHAEDRGEYVLLWLNDFTGKKPTRREAVLIKA